MLAVCKRHIRLLSSRAVKLNDAVLPITKPQRRAGQKKATPSVRSQRRNSMPIISCKRKEFNYYYDPSVKPSDTSLSSLASGGWMHYKSKGDYFTINTHAKSDFMDETTNFKELGLSDDVIDVASSLGVTSPSRIQSETIPAILGLENVLCTAETGSGKTLAYLLPLLDRLVKCRQTIRIPSSTSTYPHAVILVPSKELSRQLEGIAGQLCQRLGLNVINLANDTRKTIGDLKCSPSRVDLVIATPGTLSIGFRGGTIQPNFVYHVVVDEADTMFDDSFAHMNVNLLRKMSSTEGGILSMQLIFASATMPHNLQQSLSNFVNVKGFTVCSSSRLHCLLGHISQKFIRLGHADKPEWLANHLLQNVTPPTIIFVNKCGTATYLKAMLKEKQVSSLVIHGGVSNKLRVEQYEQFKAGDTNILICSDVMSRGVDTTQVGQIINYNMPRYISDYIHRTGRVGRLGSTSPGRVINLIAHRPEVNLVWQIEKAVRGGTKKMEFTNVNANIKRQLKAHYNV